MALTIVSAAVSPSYTLNTSLPWIGLRDSKAIFGIFSIFI